VGGLTRVCMLLAMWSVSVWGVLSTKQGDPGVVKRPVSFFDHAGQTYSATIGRNGKRAELFGMV
jgi:hypothetical protein